MTVERVNNEILIRLPASFEMKKVQAIIEYFRMLEIARKNRGSEEEAAEIAQEVDKKWWTANKQRFLKQ